MQLLTGYTYRGRALISTPVGVTHENAKAKLEAEGFSNVRVWLEGDALPADWRADAVEDTSGMLQTMVWAEVTWPGAAREFPSSGTGYQVVSPVWVQAASVVGGDGGGESACIQSGYTCAVDPEIAALYPCCPGTSCTPDAQGVKRCTPDTVGGDVVVEPAKKEDSSALKIVLGAVIVAGLGAGVWWYLRRRPAEKRNPVMPYWLTANGEHFAQLEGFGNVFARVSRDGRVLGVVDIGDSAPNFDAWERALERQFARHMTVDRLAETLDTGDSYHYVSGR